MANDGAMGWLRLIYHRTQIEALKKINEKNILRTQIEILNQELWELEKLMYNEESDRGKRND